MYIVDVDVCVHACEFMSDQSMNWPPAPLSPMFNTVHPVMYIQSVPLPVCV